MSQEKPKTYTAEFKASSVNLANESDQPIAQTAKDLGINVNTLHTWIGKYSTTPPPPEIIAHETTRPLRPGFCQKPKLTRRQQFLQEMEQVIPWQQWLGRIAPHYPAAGRGRRPFPLATLLRIHLLQQGFGYSDPAIPAGTSGRGPARHATAQGICRPGCRRGRDAG